VEFGATVDQPFKASNDVKQANTGILHFVQDDGLVIFKGDDRCVQDDDVEQTTANLSSGWSS
jgi:hypothetical protein